MAEKKKGLKEAFGGIKDILIDFSSLEVQTYTGNIAISSKITGDAKLTDFKGYLEQIKQSDANLKLVAVTKMEFDGDTINLTSESAPPAHLQEIHKASVQAGIETRQGLLTLFGKMFGIDKN